MNIVKIGFKNSLNSSLESHMFMDRKRVFIDRMGWNLSHHDGEEVDQFDDVYAIYVIISDSDQGTHLASARLLPTTRPHLLDTLFTDLCDIEIPHGHHIYELTRFCVTPEVDARRRLQLRNQLFSALVDFALMHGIQSYTGVTHARFLSQVLSIGWRCDMLGLPRETAGGTLTAVQAHVGPETISLLRRAGTYVPIPLVTPVALSCAA